MKPGRTGLRRILAATGYSIQGLKAAWRYEAAFRQELCLCVLLSILACIVPVSHLERVALVAVLFLVLIVELINSAIEAVVDRIGSEQHELSGRAKDIGSAAVLIALALAVLTWAMILWPSVVTE